MNPYPSARTRTQYDAWSIGVEPAVGMEDLAGEVPRLFRREEQRRVRDVDRLAHPPHRDRLHQVFRRGVGHELQQRGHVGLDEAGPDGLDTDAVAHELARQLLREVPNT